MWTRRVAMRVFTLAIFEHLIILLAVLASAWLRLGEEGWPTFLVENGLARTWFVAIVVQLCVYFTDLYDSRSYADPAEFFIRLINGLGAAALLLAVLYFWLPGLEIGRGVFLISALLIMAFLGAWRMSSRWATGRKARERLLLVGTGPQAVALARELFDRRSELGVEIVGFIDIDPGRVGAPVLNPGVIGAIDDIPAIAAEREVNRVVVSVADARGKLPMDKLLRMKLGGVQFDHLASVYEEYTGKIAIENLRPSWFVFSNGFQKKASVMVIKRAFDIFAASVGLLIGLPIMIAVYAGVKLTSKGPALYHQTRVGHHGKHFVVHKFRSMRVDAEAATGAVWATQSDPRVTPIGRFLRRTRLDEMPQLWNVLVGEMSLVGPRPERPEFVESLTREIPFYGERHEVKPGVTGWAQVRYTYGASVEDALEKLQYDLFYVKNFTLALDLLIAFNTVKTVLLRRGAA
ncbi:MAG: TIGR03013 family XrtA/PEP-CTERM system glycosyltransferase [Vicinamibacterales bacterium]